MAKTIVRLKESTDNAAVAALIRDSLNVWYREHMGVEECVPSVEAVCKVGDKMMVKCLDVDDRGRIKLSRKAAMAELDAQAAK